MSELSNDELADLTRRQGHQIAALEEEIRRLKTWISTEIGQMTDRAAQFGVTPETSRGGGPALNLDDDVAKLPPEHGATDPAVAETARRRSDFPAPASSVLNLDTSTTAKTAKPPRSPDRSHGHER